MPNGVPLSQEEEEQSILARVLAALGIGGDTPPAGGGDPFTEQGVAAQAAAPGETQLAPRTIEHLKEQFTAGEMTQDQALQVLRKEQTREELPPAPVADLARTTSPASVPSGQGGSIAARMSAAINSKDKSGIQAMLREAQRVIDAGGGDRKAAQQALILGQRALRDLQ